MNKIFIVDGLTEIEAIRSEYNFDLQVWQTVCYGIRSSYVQKTSRVKTNNAGKIKEYTYWYHKDAAGGLKLVGKEEPDYRALYPPKPKNPIVFNYEIVNDSHIILKSEDYEKNKDLFFECFVFPHSSLLNNGGGSND